MIQRARTAWSKACNAMEELQILRRDLDAQIEEFAKSDNFRRPYLSNTLTRILDAAMEGTHADMGNIQLYDATESRLMIHVQRGFGRPFLSFFDSVHSGQAACGTALQKARRVIVADVTDSSVFRSTDALEVLLDAGVRSVQSTPVIGRSGNVLGMLSTHYRTVGKMSERDLQLVAILARRAATIIEWQDRHTLVQAPVFINA